MSIEIKVPALGESVSEATVAKWLKKQGEAITLDEPLVELETDKVTVEVNAASSGTLSEIIAAEGDNVEVGALLGKIIQGAAPAKTANDDKPKSSPAPIAAAPAPAPAASAATPGPAARKMAADQGVDISTIPGTGKDGRVTKGDLMASPARPVSNEPREERVRMSRLRQRIAQRLKDAQNTAAILTTFNEIDMTNVMALRSQYKDVFEKKHGVKLGFMSFFIKACVHALQEIPDVNAEIDGDEIIYKNYYNIGVAVGTDQGLVVPVLRDADQKNLAGLERELGVLAAKARDGKLSMEDMSGGTFTVTNGGVYGSLMATPIINPPQTGILGMHKIEKRPVVIGDEIKIRPMMYIALSYDHRVIDGKESVTFLVRVKEMLEDPQRILLDL